MVSRGPYYGFPYVRCKDCGKVTRDPKGHRGHTHGTPDGYTMIGYGDFLELDGFVWKYFDFDHWAEPNVTVSNHIDITKSWFFTTYIMKKSWKTSFRSSSYFKGQTTKGQKAGVTSPKAVTNATAVRQ